jgi:hypothetical protein
MNKLTNNEVGAFYGISLSNMIDRIVWAVEDAVYPDKEAPEGLRNMILEFEMTHGTKAVVGMFGFIRYIQNGTDERARTPQQQIKAIRETLVHDLNARNDKLSLPRSCNYTEFAKN